MNLKPGGDLASIDGSHDGVRTRASPKLIITPKRIELALRLALDRNRVSSDPVPPSSRFYYLWVGLERLLAQLAV